MGPGSRSNRRLAAGRWNRGAWSSFGKTHAPFPVGYQRGSTGMGNGRSTERSRGLGLAASQKQTVTPHRRPPPLDRSADGGGRRAVRPPYAGGGRRHTEVNGVSAKLVTSTHLIKSNATDATAPVGNEDTGRLKPRGAATGNVPAPLVAPGEECRGSSWRYRQAVVLSPSVRLHPQLISPPATGFINHCRRWRTGRLTFGPDPPPGLPGLDADRATFC